MFETAFKNELQNLNTPEGLSAAMWNEIQKQYTSANRFYHNLTHLENLYAALLPVIGQIVDMQVVIFSIAYHDIIYNMLRHDNEEKSADLASERLAGINFPPRQIDKCRHQILATKTHDLSADSDTNFFTDADLAILGAGTNTYQLYAKQTRREYGFLPGCSL